MLKENYKSLSSISLLMLRGKWIQLVHIIWILLIWRLVTLKSWITLVILKDGLMFSLLSWLKLELGCLNRIIINHFSQSRQMLCIMRVLQQLQTFRIQLLVSLFWSGLVARLLLTLVHCISTRLFQFSP